MRGIRAEEKTPARRRRYRSDGSSTAAVEFGANGGALLKSIDHSATKDGV